VQQRQLLLFDYPVFYGHLILRPASVKVYDESTLVCWNGIFYI